jgi:hypothetical protein
MSEHMNFYQSARALIFFYDCITLAASAPVPVVADMLATLNELREEVRQEVSVVNELREEVRQEVSVVNELREDMRVVREEVVIAVTYNRLDVWDLASSKSGSERRKSEFRTTIIEYYQRQGIYISRCCCACTGYLCAGLLVRHACVLTCAPRHGSFTLVLSLAQARTIPTSCGAWCWIRT